jgi:hypothetical protein
MKTCSYCGAQYADEVEVCSIDHQPLQKLAESVSRVWPLFRSVWTLRFGILLAYLPILAFAVAFIYLSTMPRDTLHAPEDYAWAVFLVLMYFICFAALCLISSVSLLVFHFRRSRPARWALVCAVIQMVLICSLILYVKWVA